MDSMSSTTREMDPKVWKGISATLFSVHQNTLCLLPLRLAPPFGPRNTCLERREDNHSDHVMTEERDAKGFPSLSLNVIP